MHEAEKLSLEQIEAFLNASEAIRFEGETQSWLEPVLCALMRQFPLRILGFHSDNGSEFINRVVARLLNKLLIEQTKSRPRHSNDNGLAETKNGAVIRKHMGYWDMSLYKSWKMPYRETHSLQFRWDVFNVPNLTRFNAQSVGSSALLTSLTQQPDSFGAYTSLLTQPRVMQFALRYEF